VVDLEALKSNCSVMRTRADEFGIRLRGQTKTHKCVEAGIWQTGGTKR
jgi:D-serine deaminase-like pyridoxal phosphate-dependent protein